MLLVLPDTRSIKVVLPAPLAPSRTRNSPSSTVNDHTVDGLEPAEVDTEAIDGECDLSHLTYSASCEASEASAVRRDTPLPAAKKAIDQIVREAGETARQIQHDEYEDQSDDDLPRLGEAFGFADLRRNHVDDDGADAGAKDRRTAADRGPDHHRDRKCQVHEGRRGELRHHHVEHSGKTGDSGRHREEKRLIERHVEAEIARAVLVVPDRLEDQARPGFDQQSRAGENQTQRDGDEIIGRNDIGIELEVPDLEPPQIGQPVEAVGDRLCIDDHQTHQKHQRKGDDRNEYARDALAKHDEPMTVAITTGNTRPIDTPNH